MGIDDPTAPATWPDVPRDGHRPEGPALRAASAAEAGRTPSRPPARWMAAVAAVWAAAFLGGLAAAPFVGDGPAGRQAQSAAASVATTTTAAPVTATTAPTTTATTTTVPPTTQPAPAAPAATDEPPGKAQGRQGKGNGNGSGPGRGDEDDDAGEGDDD